MRFYRTGLIVHALPDFKIADSRQVRKRRNDAIPIHWLDNGVWKVFLKLQKINKSTNNLPQTWFTICSLF